MRSRISDLDFTHDAREPLVSVATDRAGLRLPFERTVHDGAQISDLWEAQNVAIETPDLRVRFAKPDRVVAPSLPSWRPGESLEAPLPSPVELNKKLSADVAWHVGKPGSNLAKLGELIDLVECREENAFAVRTSEAHATLLECEVPEPPQNRFPRHEPLGLLGGWVDAVAKAFADSHEPCIARSTRGRSASPGANRFPQEPSTRPLLPALKGRVSAAFKAGERPR